MAVTWNARANLAKLTAQGDKLEGRLRPKFAMWYGTGATVGTTKLHIREYPGGAELWSDVAEQVQFAKVILLPDIITGFEIDDLDAGHVILCTQGGIDR